MNWYYANGQQQIGPLSENDFQRLVANGTISADTLVWREGMDKWQPYTIVTLPSSEAVTAAAATLSSGSRLDLRPMSIGDILDRTFRLYRENFLNFFLIMLVVQAIAYLVTLGWEVTFVGPPRLGPYGINPSYFIGLLPAIFLSLIMTQVGIATLTMAVSSIYLGGQTSIGKAYASVRSRILRVLGASFLNTMLVGAGLILCILPGFILLMWFLLASEVVVLEGLKPVAALRRSYELMRVKTDKGFAKHNITKASVILLITFVINAVAGSIVGIPFGIAQVLSREANQLQSLTSPLHILQGVITMFVQAAVTPISTIAMILFYYDIRIRKEGFDLEVLASSLAAPPATETVSP